jgi:DHA1 family multidrug resistance protein-like MFS transporter
VTAASFIGFAGFTLVMPFLPLFIRQLGVSGVGEIALWTGAILGVTPALTAILSPFWGRLADRYGRKLMVARSLLACAVVMAAMALVTRPWQIFALRAVLGLLTGYGGLAVTMAAESAPRERMASAIGTVQTAQRLGPAIGPVVGGVLAGTLGLRAVFLVTAACYTVALVLVLVLYEDRAPRTGDAADAGRITVRSVLAFENFLLLVAVIFGIHFVDRSIGPILPLYLEELGMTRGDVPIAAGIIYSIAACSGAAGHHAAGSLLRRVSARTVISGAAAISAVGAMLLSLGSSAWLAGAAAAPFGVGIGASLTAAYTAAGSVIPHGVRATGFGMLSSASLAGLAASPVVAGFLGATSMRGVFVLDVVVLGLLAVVVRHVMVETSEIKVAN